MPDVAVIIPTHNRARLIGAALDSVLAQETGASIEVAVIDDGSTDDTPAVMQPYLDAHGDPSARCVIRYTRLEKAGVVTARNTGIASTSAPFIAFLDSDDYWAPRKVQAQLDGLHADPAVGLVHTSFRYVNDRGELTDDGPHRLNNPCVGDCVDALLHEFLIIFSSVMVRRSIVEQAAAAEPHGLPFDPRWTNSQDYDLCLRCARLSRVAYTAEPLTFYRFHDQHGAMGNLRRAFGFHCRVQMDFVERYGREVGIGEAEIRRRVQRFLLGRADAAFWQRRLGDARGLCELATELGVSDTRFTALARKASRPAWLYHMKDRADRLLGRSR